MARRATERRLFVVRAERSVYVVRPRVPLPEPQPERQLFRVERQRPAVEPRGRGSWRPRAARPSAGYNAAMSDKKHTPQRSEPPRNSQRVVRDASPSRALESVKSIQRGSERYSEALQRLAKR